MDIKRCAYWLVFAALQIAGFLALYFTNIHSNIAPLFIGIFFLLPGGILVLSNLPFSAMASIIVLVNFLAWWGLTKWGGAEWRPGK